MHEVLINRLGGLSLPRKSVVRLTDRPDMTLDVYRGRKTTNQQHKETGPQFKLSSKRPEKWGIGLETTGSVVQRVIQQTSGTPVFLVLFCFWKCLIAQGSKLEVIKKMFLKVAVKIWLCNCSLQGQVF